MIKIYLFLMILIVLVILLISLNRHKENFDDKSKKKIERLIEKFNKLNRESTVTVLTLSKISIN